MAIKGKKRSQKRPRTTRARTVAATRPTTPARTVPFHRTFEGQLAAILVALVLIGVGMFWMDDQRTEAARDEARQDRFSSFTDELRGLIADSTQPIQEMNGAPFNIEDQDAIADLDERARSWVEGLETVGARAAAMQPPEGVGAVARIVGQSFQGYSGAARTYRLVPEADGSLQEDLLERANAQRDTASQLMIAALQILDDERAEVGMDPAGIQAPGNLPPIAPTPAPEAGAGSGGEAGNDDNERRRNRDRNND